MRTDPVAALKVSGDHPLMYAFPQGAVFAFDTDLRYLAAGGLGLADVGLSRSAIEGRTIFEVFPPETASTIEPHYRAALDGNTTVFDVPFQGRIHTQRLSPVHDRDGVVVAGLGFTHDVTEAREVEQALRESEQRNRLSFQNAPVGKAIVELDGRWRQVNGAVVELTGYSEQELLGMTFQDVTHPDDLDLDLSHLNRLLAGEITSYRIEKRYITVSRRIVHVLLSVALVRDEAGNPQYFIAQIQDITELTRQRRALKDLTAMLAHDLRTATTVVSGYTELLLTAGPDLSEQERESHLQRIRAASRTMQALLDNSLTAATLDSGRLDTAPTDVEVPALIEGVLAGLGFDDVEVEIPEAGATTAWVDPTQLHQVLANLLTNARKYGGDRVAVGAQPDGGWLVITVTDNGPGVESEFVPHLFDRFSRSERARGGPERGTGLGLHIVHDLVVLNGGTIEYTSAADGGAQFTLRLPRAAGARASTREPGSIDPLGPAESL